MKSVRVLRAGTLTTLQDRGRVGHRHLGVSAGGPMDSAAFRLANLLVGNASEQAALELTLVGPALLWLQTVTLAVAGADMHPEVHFPDGRVRDLPHGRPVVVPAGTVTEFGEAKRGCRAYLAVAGGFAGPVVLGSRAALLRSGFPGLSGRSLVKGDELELCREQQGLLEAAVEANWFVDLPHLPARDGQVRVLRCLGGHHSGLLSATATRVFESADFRLSTDCDRMGYRLLGPTLSVDSQVQIRSEAVVPGTVQLTPDGQLLLLMADCAPTGGYPRIAHVITADLPLAGQLCPGDRVQFRAVSYEQSQQALLEQERMFSLVRLGLTRD